MREELNEKLAKWAGLKQVPRYGGTSMSNPLWLSPDGNHDNLCPNFTQSLDACVKWLIPKAFAGQGGIEFRYYPGGCKCIATVEDEAGFSEYEGWVKASYEGEAQKFTALALCLAFEKLVDESR